MRIILCDDDKIFTSTLKNNIEAYIKENRINECEIVEYNLGEELLKDSGDMDIVFLDIEMPGQDGIYVGNKIKERRPNTIIIIITSFAEYLDDAMRFSVFRYLSKPLDKNRLIRNLKDAIDVYIRTSFSIIVNNNGEYKKIASDNIIMIESVGRKIQMITEDNVIILNDSMQEWKEKLDVPSFFMCHRSYIINIKHVTSIKKDMVYLKNGKYQAYLSKRKYVEMKNRFTLFVETNRY